ncbi:MAG: DUF1553 domain-containing protein [Planctomycetaceae bacterium]|nr:DUF1553 domain-containing protein [Planctomycetaceae bacterium]
MIRTAFVATLLCFACLSTVLADPGTIEEKLLSENQAKGIYTAPAAPVDDLGFARRICLDLVGRIPTGKEIKTFLAWPENERRQRLIDRYMTDKGFADRFSAFFADMLRIRSNQEGGNALLAYVHQAISTDMPYDEMCRRLIATNGKAGRTPEVGFVLGDDADPMALASATAQVFMGIRISCAQCHDHPFDKWTREDFYSVAAFFGKTRRRENNLTRTVYTTEDKMSSVMWPPEDESDAADRKPMKASFPFPYLDETEELAFIQRFEALREKRNAKSQQTKGPSVDDLLASAGAKTKNRLSGVGRDLLKVSTEAKSDIRGIDINAELYKRSQLRRQLAEKITSPRNRYFSRLIVNRLWKDLVGAGFVEPVDDFRDNNPASHPKTMDYLAEEFVANGFSIRWLVKEIVSSPAYQRSHAARDADAAERENLEQAFLVTKIRRMKAEAMYDSIVTAGHLFEVKHMAGENPRVIKQRIRVPVEMTDEEAAQQSDADQPEALASNDEAMMSEQNMVASTADYGLEKAIEIDFDAVLAADDTSPMIDSMQKMSRDDIEAMRMAASPTPKPGVKYVTKLVERTVDDNPKFSSAYRMATPAPAGHFLRLFGQPARVDLGDERMENASMRQALLMLNGQLTHQAARVGPLEPVYPMLTGSDADIDKAVQYTYVEILTRKPSSDEIAEAIDIIESGADAMTGFADFRWILLNSNEFRFLP